MHNKLEEAKKEHHDIVWIDEVMFTTRTQAEKAWSHKYDPFYVDMQKTNMEPIAVVAAVSERYGVDLVMMFERSVNQHKFKEFLLKLRNKYPFRRMALVLDNLTAHKTKSVLKYMEEAGLKSIFNVPYSPDYNSIELVFAQVKHRYKRLRLEAYAQ